MKDLLQFNSSKVNPVYVINSILISIVLFLHHGSYTILYFDKLNTYYLTYVLQKFAVGGFFFFSGLKLIISNSDYSISTFLKKRLFRIYTLYIIALIVASFTCYPFLNDGNIPSIQNFIIHALCFQIILPDFFEHNYHTLWFVPVLLICYILFLFLQKDIVNTKKFITKQVGICSLVSIVYLYTQDKGVHLFFQDLSIYILFFTAGMISVKLNVKNYLKYQFLLAPVIGNVFLILMYKYLDINTWYIYITYTVLVITSNIPLFVLSMVLINKINFSQRTKSILSQYSFASFCIFLFHRSIWAVLSTAYPQDGFLQWLFIILIGVPIIFLCAYSIQHSYNLIPKHFSNK